MKQQRGSGLRQKLKFTKRVKKTPQQLNSGRKTGVPSLMRPTFQQYCSALPFQFAKFDTGR